MTNDVKKNLWLFVYFADKEKGIIKPEHIFLSLFVFVHQLGLYKPKRMNQQTYITTDAKVT